jgi:inorganic triphosphatase YgiF
VIRVQELETKYLLDQSKKPAKALRRLLQDLVWAGFQIHPKSTRLVHDVYFDTADQRLQHAGWSLRCRHRRLALQLTCKQLGRSAEGWFERREIEQSTLHDTPSLASLEDGPVLSLLRRYIPTNAELIPTLSQDNRRTAYNLSHPDYPRSAIELVMDRVTVAGQPDLHYVEFEGELKQGPTTLLAEFSAVMAAQPNLAPSRSSKFQRGHFNSNPTLSIGNRSRDLMTPDDSWTRLCASYLAEQIQTLQAYEPFAWEGVHPEGVHQMRVATRRLRAALKTFRDVLPKEKARALIREASWLCDRLGAVRDLDVHIERLELYRSKTPLSRHTSLSEYERHLKRDLIKARRCLLVALGSQRFKTFLNCCQSLQQRADTGTDSAANPQIIRRFATADVVRRLRKIRKAGRALNADSVPERYHRLRIRIKKLRYQLEILQGPYGKELVKAAKVLRRLQVRLGDHQDACVARQELAQYRVEHVNGSRDRRTFDSLVKLEVSQATRMRNQFQRDWIRFEAKSHKITQLL